MTMTPQEIEDHLNADGPGRTLADATPAELDTAGQNWALATENVLAERIYAAAVAYKEAEDDKTTGKWALAARWSDYTKALTAHAIYTVAEFKATRETTQEPPC